MIKSNVKKMMKPIILIGLTFQLAELMAGPGLSKTAVNIGQAALDVAILGENASAGQTMRAIAVFTVAALCLTGDDQEAQDETKSDNSSELSLSDIAAAADLDEQDRINMQETDSYPIIPAPQRVNISPIQSSNLIIPVLAAQSNNMTVNDHLESDDDEITASLENQDEMTTTFESQIASAPTLECSDTSSLDVRSSSHHSSPAHENPNTPTSQKSNDSFGLSLVRENENLRGKLDNLQIETELSEESKDSDDDQDETKSELTTSSQGRVATPPAQIIATTPTKRSNPVELEHFEEHSEDGETESSLCTIRTESSLLTTSTPLEAKKTRIQRMYNFFNNIKA